LAMKPPDQPGPSWPSRIHNPIAAARGACECPQSPRLFAHSSPTISEQNLMATALTAPHCRRRPPAPPRSPHEIPSMARRDAPCSFPQHHLGTISTCAQHAPCARMYSSCIRTASTRYSKPARAASRAHLECAAATPERWRRTDVNTVVLYYGTILRDWASPCLKWHAGNSMTVRRHLARKAHMLAGCALI
jgi:hypothetical protein